MERRKIGRADVQLAVKVQEQGALLDELVPEKVHLQVARGVGKEGGVCHQRLGALAVLTHDAHGLLAKLFHTGLDSASKLLCVDEGGGGD